MTIQLGHPRRVMMLLAALAAALAAAVLLSVSGSSNPTFLEEEASSSFGKDIKCKCPSGSGSGIGSFGGSGGGGTIEEVIVTGQDLSGGGGGGWLDFGRGPVTGTSGLDGPGNGPSFRAMPSPEAQRAAEDRARNRWVIEQRRNGMNDADQINMNYIRMRNRLRSEGYQIP